MLGWKAYVGMAQTPRVWRELDEWLRHRLRAIQLKHWKRRRAIYRELKALGVKENVARQVAVNSRRSLARQVERAPVQQVASNLGYDSVTAFITMFKKSLGKPPAQYFASLR